MQQRLAGAQGHVLRCAPRPAVSLQCCNRPNVHARHPTQAPPRSATSYAGHPPAWRLASSFGNTETTTAVPPLSFAELIRQTGDAESLRDLLATQLVTVQQAVVAITHLAHMCTANGGETNEDTLLLEELLCLIDEVSCLELHGSELASILCSVSGWQAPLPTHLLKPAANELLRETTFLPKLYTLSVSELVALVISFSRQPVLADDRLWHQLCKALAVRASQLQLPQLADVATLCVEQQCQTPELMDAIAAAVLSHRDMPSPDQVAQLFLAFAGASHPHTALVSSLAQTASLYMKDYSPHQMVAVLSSCLALQHRPSPQLLHEICTWAQIKIHAFTASHLAQLAKSAAAFNVYDHTLAASIAAAATRQVADFTPVQAVELLWAMSAWQHFNHDLCAAFAKQSTANLPQFPPTTLAILLWSLAALGYYNPPLFAAAAAALEPHLACLPPLPPRSARSPARRSPTRRAPSPPRLRAPSPAAPLRGGSASLLPSGSAGSARQQRPPTPEPLGSSEALQSNHLSAVALYNIAWAYAAVRHYDADFLALLGTAVSVRVNEFEADELAGLLGAFADVSFTSREAVDTIGQALYKRVPQLKLEGAAVAAWGLAMGGCKNVPLVQALFDHAAGFAGEEPSLADVVRLRQAYIMLRGRMYLEIPLPLQHMFDRTAAHLRRYSGALAGARSAAVQEFRDEVCEVVAALGAASVPAYQTECGFFLLDLVVELGDGVCVAVELVTRDKVSNTLPRRLWGGTVAVRRCLEAEGWRVIGVDREVWDLLPGREERRQLLLRELQSVIEDLD